jgi:hypothetical protein
MLMGVHHSELGFSGRFNTFETTQSRHSVLSTYDAGCIEHVPHLH